MSFSYDPYQQDPKVVEENLQQESTIMPSGDANIPDSNIEVITLNDQNSTDNATGKQDNSSNPELELPVEDKTTLWMGELEPWADENYVRQIWYNLGEEVNVKVIRDKFSGSNAGYCFVEFASPDAANNALKYNGTLISNTNRPFKLNWASGGGLMDRRDERPPEYSIFVGDLGPEVSEFTLTSIFQSRYPSCTSANIISDSVSGLSRGYGFVRFSDESDRTKALTEMQGVYAGNRPMRISKAFPKNKSSSAASGGSLQGQLLGMPLGMGHMGFYGAPQSINQFTDPNNTTVFVGGLSGYVTEDELRSFFQGFGEITYVKIPPGRGCGFVQFVQRHAAEMAINQMQGYPIGNSRIRLSWGRSQNSSGAAGTPYRAAPPPAVYSSMGIPPQHHYSPYAPVNHHAAHMHALSQRQTGPPGEGPIIQSISSDPNQPISTQRMNEMYEEQDQQRQDRLEADSRGFHSIYSQ